MEQVCRAPPLGGITTNPGGVYPDHQQGWWLSRVAVIPSRKTAGWRYKDKYDPVQMRCTNCGYLISSVEVEPVDTEVNKPLIKICPRCASEMKLEDRKKG